MSVLANALAASLRLIACVAALVAAAGAAAHDIPSDVVVRAYVRPSGDRLQLLLHVPLAAMIDVDYPRRSGGYIDVARVEPALRQAAMLWVADNLDVYEGAARLPYPKIAAVRLSLPSDRSFDAFSDALAHLVAPPLPSDIELVWNQQFLDALLEYPIASQHAQFSIHPRFARLGQRVVTALVFLPPGGASRAFELRGDPGLVRLDPRWSEAARRFVELGFMHILDGADHLLFLLCVLLPFRRFASLLVIVTSFTVAHSITLIGAALGHAPDALWFPPLVETLIAASIVYMAIENVFGSSAQRRWMVTFAFGLAHGFGFSFALRESLQFAGSHLLTALFAFNAGVELAQLAAIAVLVPACNLLFRFVPERIAIIVASALVAHTAWHWMAERWTVLRQFPMPRLDGAFYVGAMRWLGAMLLLILLVWGAHALLRRTTWLRVPERKMHVPPTLERTS